jgi:hypothetical protein
MTYYSVLIETRDEDGAPLTGQAFSAFADALAAFDGVAGFGDAAWSARISVEADSAAGAVALGAALVTSLGERAGLPGWPVVRAEAVREDVLAEDLAQPPLPDLVSAAEAAAIAGAPADSLGNRGAEPPGFPAPVLELGPASLWLRAAVTGFAEEHERRKGPRRPAGSLPGPGRTMSGPRQASRGPDRRAGPPPDRRQ